MNKSFIFSLVLIGFICLFLFSVSSLPNAGEETLAEGGNKGLNLNIKPGSIQTAAVVKPDLNFGKFPLYFITNKGQVNKKAKFYAKASKYTLWLTKGGLVFDSTRIKENPKSEYQNPEQIKNSSFQNPKQKQYQMGQSALTTHHSPLTKYDRDVSRLMFIGANKNPELVPIKKAKLKVNYFIGNDRCKWHCDIPTSPAVLYKSLYKNIDLKVYGIEKQIEYDWIVKPGGNPADIRFVYKNVKNTRIDDEGDLVIETEFGELIHKKPINYQENRRRGEAFQHRRFFPLSKNQSECFARTMRSKEYGEKNVRATGRGRPQTSRTAVDVEFKKIGKNTYSFAVGDYDKSRELVIDPVVLAYSTYLGGENTELGHGIAVDSSGYAYVGGLTWSTDFPTLNQYQLDQSTLDVFITKIDTTQSGTLSLVYSTYLGGSNADSGIDIAVDSSGNAYVTGLTHSTDFPTLNQYQSTSHGLSDAFVTKIDTTQSGASSLVYSTYLGGSSFDSGSGISVDNSGNAFLSGRTDSTDFPILNHYQTDQPDDDAFVTRIDTTQAGASSLVYSTYLGGSSWDCSYGIALDSSGNVYVTGETWSLDFPILNHYQTDQPGKDAFVTKIDTTQAGASSLVYSTYLGGNGSDTGQNIAVDSSGNVYVTGETWSPDFPILDQFQEYQAYDDVFVTKLDTTRAGAASLIYSTYLGGSSYDTGCGIAIDDRGDAYITGETYSSDFPILNQFQMDQPSRDAFVTKLTIIESPTVTTAAVTSITATSAVSGGNVTFDGGAPVTNRGVCWSTSANPTTVDSFTSDGSGTGSFTSSITGLTPGTTYYVRAYAANSAGTGYGETLSFKTLDIVLSLHASRESESAWLIRRQYGKINLDVQNPGNIPVAEYVIYRKEAGGNYSPLIEVPGSQLQGGSYLYYDKYLDKAKSYTYKSKAVDAKGVIIGESNEKTI